MGLFADMREDIDAIMARDPAARSRFEVVLCYPGFHARVFHRMANALWRHGWLVPGRFVSHIGRFLTGIEIHPGAMIGRRFFVDHGMGCVVGETAQIGDDVTLYHGVTLGGTALEPGKRHPTLHNGVVVGAGAQVLGPVTVHENARIGANAVVLKDVPAGVTMVGIPARPVLPRAPTSAQAEFHAYGTPSADLPDPVAKVIDGLLGEISGLRARVADLEESRSDAAESEPGQIEKSDRSCGEIGH